VTLAPADLGLYAAAVFALFLTPGPVWMALTARTLAGGVRGAWPLAAGVVIGDALWSLLRSWASPGWCRATRAR